MGAAHIELEIRSPVGIYRTIRHGLGSRSWRENSDTGPRSG